MSLSDKWFAVINPMSGNGRGKSDWPEISRLLNNRGVTHEYLFSEYAGHAGKLAGAAVEKGYRKVIIVGGDGTIHEVVNGLFSQKSVPTTEITIAVIAIGSGNDWVRMYGIPQKYSEAVETIVKGYSIAQDVGEATFHDPKGKQTAYIANGAGIGLDAEVIRRFTESNNRRQSKVRYFWTLLKSVFGYRSAGMEVWIDGKMVANEPVCSIAVGIGRYSGSGMMQVPLASVNDGLFDISVIRHVSKMTIIRNVGKLYNGRIYTIDKVSHYRGQSVKVTAPERIDLEIDGEPLGKSPYEFRLIEKAINVIASEKNMLK